MTTILIILMCYHILCIGAFTQMLIAAEDIPELNQEIIRMKGSTPYYRLAMCILTLVCASYIVTSTLLSKKTTK